MVSGHRKCKNQQEIVMDGCSIKDRPLSKNTRACFGHSVVSLSNFLPPLTSTPNVTKSWISYLVVLVFVGDLERLHGSDHSLHGCEDVLVDQLGETPFVLIRVARAVDNPHLFDKCALSTFTSA